MGNCSNGYGAYTWRSGEKYIGQFEDETLHGQGTYTWPSGQIFVGQFKNGTQHGQGSKTFSNGEKYVGRFKDGKSNGLGSYTWPTGEKHFGQYKDGKSDGQGTATWPNGQKYVGQFKEDLFNGQGTINFPNGQKYVGQFKDGKFNGQGTYIWSSGQKYVGQFKDGKSNGQGTKIWPTGEKFVGLFEDDNIISGQGTRYLFDSRQIIYVGNRAELRDSNGELIQFSLSASKMDSLRAESRRSKRHYDDKLARKSKASRDELAEKGLQRISQIKDIQQQLIDHFYLSGSADGVVGVRTRNALKQFYKDTDLKLPSLDAYQIIANDLTSNLIELRGSCSVSSYSSMPFKACFTIQR